MKSINNFYKLIYLTIYSFFFHYKKTIEIIFSDKKYEFDTDFKNFLDTNRIFWKDEKKKNKKILVSDFVHQIGFLTTECVIGNYVKNVLDNDFELVGLLDAHDNFGKSVFESYSVKDFIGYPRISFFKRLKFILKSMSILNNYKKVDDFLNFSIKETNIGKPVYDHILRNTGIGTSNKIGLKFYFYLAEALYAHNFFSKIFQNNDFEYLIMSENQFLPSSIVFQVALENNTKVVQRVLGPKKIGVRLYDSNYKKFEVHLKINNKLFNKFYESDNNEKYSELGFNLINKLFSGEMTHYDQNSLNVYNKEKKYSTNDFYEKMEWEKSTRICTIFSHNLLDGNYNNDWRIFKDNLTWLRETLHFVVNSKQNINWIVKEHPSEYGKKKAKTSTYEEFIKIVGLDKKNIKFFPKEFNSSILKETTNFVLTSQGSAGYEYPCFGIPSMICGDSFYQGFGISIEPNNSEQYFNYLKDLENLIDKGISKDQLKRARILFYICNDVIKINHPLLPEFDISRALNKKFFYNEMIDLINNYDPKSDKFKIDLRHQFINSQRHMFDSEKL